MRFKLDENLGRQGAAILSDAGFDVSTVSDQQLTSAPDREVITRCVEEGRCLVTMDAEFGNPMRFRRTTTGASRCCVFLAGRRAS